MPADTRAPRLAVLIDADNIPARHIEAVLDEIAGLGEPSVRRVYGDWSSSALGQWKEKARSLGLVMHQQSANTKGKNASDIGLVIDAMDILHSETVDGFCVVSSDSDYTRLATRIRESGIFVMGIGKRITPKAFVNACNVFIFTENLDVRDRTPAPKGKRTTKQTVSKDKEEKKKFDPLPLLKGAFDMAIQEDGWANIATMGFYLRQLDPSFDPRTYGHKQLSQLLKSQSKIFDMRFQETPGSTDIYVRLKD